ncbi:ABC transporter permease [Streptomyces albipurpureus]|uniref:FtsX-like permease family protein n=1 Tax=Streptomyces albipurpureus TaxID=2897419 RepID=A0ABT0UTN3_9ACTN|nr:FtsX-like permease family protein [Streptomyces sp. CWNU-1]MCM2391947.1 FtsX-like permease family protein [Streptomyces sp. CWNU-1]
MFAPNGLARAAIRFKPSAFIGTFVALMMTAVIVSACGIMLETGVRAEVPAARYEKAPVVVAADQQIRHTFGSGEEKSTEYAQIPDKARVDDSLLPAVAAAPGVAAAIGDVVFPVQRDKAPLSAQGWDATAFTGTRLTEGAAPRTGEVVLGEGGAKVGQRVRLETPVGEREFRVSGVARGDGAWFSTAQAVGLSGHPGKLDAIAVLPKDGVSPGQLSGEVRKAVDGKAKIRTKETRGEVEDLSLGMAKEALIALGASFGGIATMVAVFTAAGTVALSVGLRRREFALLRAIGATPRQIRRTIATEGLLVAPLAGVIGCVPGVALASWWFGQLKEKGAVPQAVELAVSPLPLSIAVASCLVTALLAGWAAARRPAKIKPGEALADAAVERVGFGKVRTPLGIAALAGGVVLTGISASASGEDAANTALGVVMSFMLAVALLGPLIARACAGLFGLPLRAAGASASLAAANSRTNSRRLASAMTPIVLAMSFSSVLIFLQTSTDRAAEEQQRAGMSADHLVSAPGGLPMDAAERAERVPGVSAAVGLVRTSVLVSSATAGDVSWRTASVQGLHGDPAALTEVQDLDVRKGSMGALAPGRIAVDAAVADGAGVGIGDRLEIRLPDGTQAKPEIVATYGRGLGFSDVTMTAADLSGRVTSPYPNDLLVRGTPEAAERLAALGTVRDRGDYASAQNTEREVGAWGNRTMAAILGGFAAIAAANTLVMTVLDRRRELGMLRLIGSTRRQVMGMIRWEALLVTGAGVVLGSAIALATLIPMMKGLTGEAPYVPPLVYGSFVAAIAVLALGATALPARAAMRGTGV